MQNTAPPQDMTPILNRPHDTTRKPLDRRHRARVRPDEELEKLRALCHYQGMLIELQKAEADRARA